MGCRDIIVMSRNKAKRGEEGLPDPFKLTAGSDVRGMVSMGSRAAVPRSCPLARLLRVSGNQEMSNKLQENDEENEIRALTVMARR